MSVPLSYRILFLLLLPSLAFTQSAENLTLEQAIEIGLKNNYAILISKNNAKIAANDAALGNAGFLPSLDVTAGANKSKVDTKQELASGLSSEQDGAETKADNAGIILTWTVFDGFNRIAT